MNLKNNKKTNKIYLKKQSGGSLTTSQINDLILEIETWHGHKISDENKKTLQETFKAELYKYANTSFLDRINSSIKLQIQDKTLLKNIGEVLKNIDIDINEFINKKVNPAAARAAARAAPAAPAAARAAARAAPAAPAAAPAAPAARAAIPAAPAAAPAARAVAPVAFNSTNPFASTSTSQQDPINTEKKLLESMAARIKEAEARREEAARLKKDEAEAARRKTEEEAARREEEEDEDEEDEEESSEKASSDEVEEVEESAAPAPDEEEEAAPAPEEEAVNELPLLNNLIFLQNIPTDTDKKKEFETRLNELKLKNVNNENNGFGLIIKKDNNDYEYINNNIINKHIINIESSVLSIYRKDNVFYINLNLQKYEKFTRFKFEELDNSNYPIIIKIIKIIQSLINMIIIAFINKYNTIKAIYFVGIFYVDINTLKQLNINKDFKSFKSFKVYTPSLDNSYKPPISEDIKHNIGSVIEVLFKS